MKCPQCGLFSPDSAQRCDCGYDFGTQQGGSRDALRARSQLDPLIVNAPWLICGVFILGTTLGIRDMRGKPGPDAAGDLAMATIFTTGACAIVALMVLLTTGIFWARLSDKARARGILLLPVLVGVILAVQVVLHFVG